MVGENAPPLEGWVCEPRPCVIFDLLPRMSRDDVTPPNITLGEN